MKLQALASCLVLLVFWRSADDAGSLLELLAFGRYEDGSSKFLYVSVLWLLLHLPSWLWDRRSVDDSRSSEAVSICFEWTTLLLALGLFLAVVNGSA